MPGIVSNLYPPIVNTLMPAFIYTSICRVYFSISDYNALSSSVSSLSQTSIIDINKVQVIVQKQKTNQNALKSSTYPSGIKITSLKVDNTITNDNKYYIQIKNSDIQGGFNLNQYYKVQIRFTDTAAASLPNGSGIDNWLSENLQHFSQWSTVTLIYGISTPTISLKNLVQGQLVTLDIFDSVIGSVSFADNNDTEILDHYQIFLYLDTSTSSTRIENSGIIYTNKYNNPNQINYTINYNLLSNVNYKLRIEAVTKNSYSFLANFTFKIIKTQPQLELDISTQSDQKNGSIKIIFTNNFINSKDTTKYVYDSTNDKVTGKILYLNIISPTTAEFSSVIYMQDTDELILYNGEDINHDISIGTRFVIKRASNKQNNFNKWTTMGDITIEQKDITKMIWSDYTVQLGVWYKYQIIRYNSYGQRTSSIILEPEMVVSYDVFLTSGDKQLKIKFDPQITNFSIKTSQATIETIGSQYPFIQRNGNIKYKTFSLSGTITHFMDTTENLFNASKKDLYGTTAYPLYQKYNEDNKINPFYDYIYEKQYRNKVIDFLYQNNIKLFRSLTEGNIFVKLMDITLTPNTTLNRMIYSFSCTAYEIDNNIQNMFTTRRIKI